MLEILAMITVIAVVMALAAYFIRTSPPQYAENVSRDEAPFGLPACARDVSFCQGQRGTIAFEFAIDERGFIDWVKSGIGSFESEAAQIPLREITTPQKIHRYHLLVPGRTGADSITVSSGLYYHWSEEDRGVTAIFDRATRRAYYFSHSH